MMSLKRRTAWTIFVIGIMIWIHGLNLVQINSSTSECAHREYASRQYKKFGSNDCVTRGNNSTGEDFEDDINELAWSTYSSNDPNGTNERSNYDAYDGSTYSWRMDTSGTQPNLNELVMHVGLDAGEDSVTGLKLTFATREYGTNNQDIIPNESDGHVNGDGVAVSDDGLHWYKLWQYPSDHSSWTMIGPLDVLALCPDLEMDPKEDFYLKFQQYGSGSIPNDGILWDNITLLVNGSGQAIPEIILNLPEPEVEAEISYNDIYATDQGDNGNEAAEVSITVTGKGEESDVSGEDIQIKYEIADGLGITDYGNPNINGDTYEWYEDFLMWNEEWVISFTLNSDYPFNGSIGSISYSYISWDGDLVDWIEMDGINLKVIGIDAVEIEVDDGIGGERIISGKPDGSLLTANAYDQDGIVMPAQDFTWSVDSWSYGLTFEDMNKNSARIIADEWTSGNTGNIILTHIATDREFRFDYTITWGSAFNIEVILVDPYIVGEHGVLIVSIQDNYNNSIENWTEKIYVNTTEGEVNFTNEVLVEDDGGIYDGWLYYEFKIEDRGQYTFVFTPNTYWGESDTVIHFEISGGISTDVSLDVEAGPVKSLSVLIVESDIYMGEPFHITVQAKDKYGNNNTRYDTPLIVTHDCMAYEEDLEPSPWKDMVGDVTLQMEDGTYRGDQKFYFNMTGHYNITVKSRVNHAINGNCSFQVLSAPGSLTEPGSPLNLQLSAGDGFVDLSWETPDDDGGSSIINYNIYRGTTSGSLSLLTTVGDLLTYSDTSVVNDVTYYYQVSAENIIGEGPRSNEVSAIPEAPPVIEEPHLTAQDFKNLSYSDPKGDDYTFYFEGKSDDDTVTDSFGIEGKYGYVDIVDLKAELVDGEVTVTIKHADDIMYGMSMAYYVFFVDSAHEQSGSLLKPQDHTEGTFSYTYSDSGNSIVYIKLEDDMFEGTYAWSYPEMDSLTWKAEGGTITYTVSTSDLEDVGVWPGSGFGVYAISCRMESMPGDTWYNKITWDSAGAGAADPPKEFNVKLAETKLGGEDKGGIFGYSVWVIILAIGIVLLAVILVIVIVLVKKRKRKEEGEKTEMERTEIPREEYVSITEEEKEGEIESEKHEFSKEEYEPIGEEEKEIGKGSEIERDQPEFPGEGPAPVPGVVTEGEERELEPYPSLESVAVKEDDVERIECPSCFSIVTMQDIACPGCGAVFSDEVEEVIVDEKYSIEEKSQAETVQKPRPKIAKMKPIPKELAGLLDKGKVVKGQRSTGEQPKRKRGKPIPRRREKEPGEKVGGTVDRREKPKGNMKSDGTNLELQHW